ncbi:hypothetical protein EZS27_004723 [termite gut metagenome]|uniref:Lipoprotein n=1 Tax=termite gut metagenome TaxID=433724 RepID=A0A5J4SPH5_9ZZZZ
MKKILLLTGMVVLFSSCMTANYFEKTSTLDFSKYHKEGFIISPIAEGFQYTPISSISIKFRDGALKGYSRSKEGLSTVVGVADNWFSPSIDYMLDAIVKEAKKQGADAILNFNAKNVSKKTPLGALETYYELSGFAVKLDK